MLSLRWLYIQLKCAHHTIDVTIFHHASKIFMREYVSLFFTRIPQSKIVYLLFMCKHFRLTNRTTNSYLDRMISVFQCCSTCQNERHLTGSQRHLFLYKLVQYILAIVLSRQQYVMGILEKNNTQTNKT